MRTLRRIQKLAINCALWLVSLMIIKERRGLLFGSWFGQRFADNSRYLFQYCSANKAKFRLSMVVFVSKDKALVEELKTMGYTAYDSHSFKGIFYHFRCGIHIIDQQIEDINPYFSVRSKRICLWHGIPLKKIGLLQAKLERKNRYIQTLFTKGFWGKKYFLATSAETQAIFEKAFDLFKYKTLLGVYPRNYYLKCYKKAGDSGLKQEQIELEALFPLRDIEKNYYHQILVLKEEKQEILFYLPTFREHDKLNFLGLEESNIARFNEFLKAHHQILVTKLHMIEKNHQPIAYSNIISLPPTLDIYCLLPLSDLLITDYSSVFFDYLYLDKPILFFPYDLAYYETEDKGFIFDFQEITPGEKVYSYDEFCKSLCEKRYNSASFTKKRHDIKQRIFKWDNLDLLVQNILK